MTTKELLPCPFCKAPNEYEKEAGSFFCNQCKVYEPTDPVLDERAAAIAEGRD